MAREEEQRPPGRNFIKMLPSRNQAHWKDKLRENCCKRVQENRARLLWKLRLAESDDQPANDKEIIKSTFQEMVAEEFKKIRSVSSNEDTETLASASRVDDMLWEYNGLHEAYQGECEDILLEMQRIFYEDLEKEAKTEACCRTRDVYKTWEDEQDEYLARSVYEHMQLNDGQVPMVTWCPICKQGELQQTCSLISCTLCEFKLNRDNEVTMDFLRDRLAEVHTEHLERGCRLKPKFCIETRFDLSALYIECQGCCTFEVVI